MARRICNIQDVAAWRMCMGCGTCLAACTKNGVELVNVESEGIRPRFRSEVCSNCVDCLDVCPGCRLDADLVMDGRVKTTEADHEFGQVLELWEGYAADPEIRYQASSGGLLSALSIYCLEREGMRFALHTGMDPDKPWLNRTLQSRTREDILLRCGSRYAPASPCEGLRAIEESEGPCVFIGKPCDTAGASMLRRKRPGLDRNLGLVLSFCCAGTPSTLGTLDLLKSMGVRTDQVCALRYRGEGWPGGFKVSLSGNDRGGRFLPYMASWRRLTKYIAFRCRLCPDGLGRLADITCGDAWHSYQDGTTDPGRSIVLVRTSRGREILRRARAAGYVELRPINAQAVLAAQPNLLGKRRQLFGRLLAMRMFLVPVPRLRGFSLFRGWWSLSLPERFRSVAGTIKRILIRSLWREEKPL